MITRVSRSTGSYIASLSLCTALFSGLAEAALFTWQNPGTGDWIDAANWTPAGVPGPLDTAEIQNGGSADAVADITITNLSLGTTTTVSSAAGSLDITAGKLNLDGFLRVGSTQTPAATATSATGSLAVAGAIDGVRLLEVGSNRGANSTAQGAVTADSLSGNPTLVLIGRDDVGGSGTGSLILNNAITLANPVNIFEVGYTVFDGLNADGELRAGSGDIVTDTFGAQIGAHFGDNSAPGSARGVVDLGSGSLSNLSSRALNVGVLASGHQGTAEGTLNVAGLTGFGTQSVGVAGTNAVGSATGTLNVGVQGIQGGSLSVGSTDTADATGAVTVAGGGITLNTGGLSLGETDRTGTAQGALTLAAGDLQLRGGLGVGNVEQAAATATSATGSLAVAGAIDGVSVFLEIGSNRGANSTAQGAVTADSLSGNPTLVLIGRDDAGGSGTGSLILNNAITLANPLTFFEVGYTVLDGLNADGELRAGSGDIVTDTFGAQIGAHFGDNSAPGSARGVVDLGSGSLSNLSSRALNVGVLAGGHQGTADGTLNVAGLTGFGTQSVGVAGTNAVGSATGTLNVGVQGIQGGSLSVGSTNTADATGAVTVAGGGITLNTGGLSLGETTGTGTAQGALTLAAGDLQLRGGLGVGNVEHAAATATSATGSLAVAGAIDGVSVFLEIGSNRGANSTAQGAVTADSLSGDQTFVLIGRDDAGGSGTGSLILNNAITLANPLTFFEVGYTVSDGLNADGELRAGSGDIVTDNFGAQIGAHFGDNSAPGSARGVVDLGSGSLSNLSNKTLNVGVLAGAHQGTAEGTLNVAGLNGFNTQSVGVAGINAVGSATGTLNVGVQGIQGGSLSVGSTDTADATGAVTVAGGGVTLNTGGLSLGETSGTGTAQGALTLAAGDLQLSGGLGVGNARHAAATATSATGSLAVAGAIDGVRRLEVGNNSGANSTAQGAVTADSLSGDPTFVLIGRDHAGGSGTGSLILNNAITLANPVNIFEVGYTVLDGLNADGELRAGSGDIVTNTFGAQIGAHFGDNSAPGSARGVVDLGSGSLSNLSSRALNVGVLASGHQGTAEGTLNVAGLTGFGAQSVGVAGINAVGSATGTLNVGVQGIQGGSLSVGSTDTADATGAVTVAGGGITLNTGGLSLGETDRTGTAQGALTLAAGDLQLSGGLGVGNVEQAAATATSATGSLAVAGAIDGASRLEVGNNRGANSTAQGAVTADSLSGNPTLVLIGRDDAGGSGTGSLILNNAITLANPLTFFEVGYTVLDGLNADGELRAGSGDIVTDNFGAQIGAHFGDNSAPGSARGVVDLGSGSLSNLSSRALNVGVLAGAHQGTAEGTLNVAGITGFGTQSVGVAGTNAVGSATGTLNVGVQGIQGGSLSVGSTDTADVSGSVEVSGGNIDLGTGVLTVGTTRGTGEAEGSLVQFGGNLLAGSVIVGQSNGDGVAQAVLGLTGVVGTVQSLDVGGSNDPDGIANGRVLLSDSRLDVLGTLTAGEGRNGGSGNGELALSDSHLTALNMSLANEGVASWARMSLERSLVEVAEEVVFGSGSQLLFDIEGGTRVTQYGAINTRQAQLGGALQVQFNFTPFASSMIFDLIVSGFADGISGDFSSVDILGLDPGFNVTSGVVVDTVSGSSVEIYRLRIARADIPTPGSLALLLLGIALLYRRRRAQAAQAA